MLLAAPYDLLLAAPYDLLLAPPPDGDCKQSTPMSMSTSSPDTPAAPAFRISLDGEIRYLFDILEHTSENWQYVGAFSSFVGTNFARKTL